MHGVPGAFGHDMPFNPAPGQGQVPDQVQNLVAHILVGEAQRAVLRTELSQNDGILRSCPADESHVAQALLVGLVAEGASWGDSGAVPLCSQIDASALPADGGGEVDRVLNAVARARINPDELVALPHLYGLQHANVLAAAALGADTRAEKRIHVRLRAAVENRKLQVVELHNDVVDAHADEGREE